MPRTPDPSPAWRRLLGLLPGYDPFRDAAAVGAWFDAEAAQQACDFFPACLRHVEGALTGQPFQLQDWQKAFVGNLFGWKMKDEAGRVVRRYRKALLYVPRKNGKTPLVAGLALYVLFCDHELGQQGYIAAADRGQAGMLFRHCKGMIEQEPELSSRCTIYGGNASAGQSKSIVVPATSSFLQVISADAHTKHGGNTHLAIVDELHTQPGRDLVDTLETSTASLNRAQPLTVWITTADHNRPSICNEKHKDACDYRDGIRSDPRFLPAVYETLPDEDWTDPKVWAKANPNLGVSVSLDYLRAECEAARANPEKEGVFRRLHLNTKTETAVRAIPMDRWDACAADVADPWAWRLATLERLRGAECFAGLDLGSVGDLTALVLLWDEGDHLTAVPWFWVPKSNAEKRSRQDRVPYGTWIKQGWISATDGDETDYDTVRADVLGLSRAYWIKEVAADRLFQGVQVCRQLTDDGLEVIAFGQGYASMAAPVRQLIEWTIGGRLRHGANPVLRWMASNAAAERSKRKDVKGKVQEVLKFSKDASGDKIDGITAMAMAIGRLTLTARGAGPSISFV